MQVPATGCSVVGLVLEKQFAGEEIGRKHDDVPRLLASGALSKSDLERVRGVANVRNPFDRHVTYNQRLNGTWIDEYFAFRGRDLERRKQRDGLSEGDVEREKQRIKREEKRKRRRARILQLVGLNIWVTGTVMRWRLRDRKSRANHAYPYLHHLFAMLDHVQLVLRQEQLEADLNALLGRLHVDEAVSVPRKNLTPDKKPYTELLPVESYAY